MKKFGLGFYFTLVTVVLGVVALGIYLSNVNNSYYSDLNPNIVMLTTGGIISGVLSIVLSRFRILNYIADLTAVITPILFSIAMCMFISARAYSMAIILGSDLEKGNQQAWEALSQSFIGMGVFGLAILVALVSAFMKQVKKPKVVTES